ncbi:hypothetical protein P3T76_015855 [Phytophthora citrophthora]|uniref:Uncharacterized protein n=1 Tax=Phytophthora citrophthora TaxID=4793 RepID=A0AAD9L9V6_9STRA|nr:hypothetical protein P3T76_015855 [Phytophthora citrophthora]
MIGVAKGSETSASQTHNHGSNGSKQHWLSTVSARCNPCSRGFFFSSTASTDSTKAGCRVRFGGTIDGHSEEFARRWQREIFFMLMRWEAHNVAPVLLLPQSETA